MDRQTPLSTLSRPVKVRGQSRPPGLRPPATAPTGPRIFSQPVERKGAGAGPLPPGFSGPVPEWIVYSAFAKVLRDPPDPRVPPYFGGTDWGYQIGTLGTFTRQLGSAVVDFVYYAPHDRIFIRLQTARFHEAFGPAQQGYDVIQRALLEGQGRVVDINESDFLGVDPAGGDPLTSNLVLAAACVVVKAAIGLTERGSPISLGTSRAKG